MAEDSADPAGIKAEIGTMPRHREEQTIAIAAAVSLVAMTFAAYARMHWLSIAGAALFALAAIVIAVRTNFSENGSAGAHRVSGADDVETARRNAHYMAAVYGWGGLAMLSIYLFTGLHWRHGWQYGTGMLLISAGILIYARNMLDPQSSLRTVPARNAATWMAIAQGAAAGVALVIMILSGKLMTLKDDWAANHVFVAGGLAILVVSLSAAAKQRRLAARI